MFINDHNVVLDFDTTIVVVCFVMKYLFLLNTSNIDHLYFDHLINPEKNIRSMEISRPSDELGADTGTPDEHISSE